MQRAVWVVLCVLSATPTVRHGTALAALRSSSQIAIAVDSRVVDRLGMRLADACKLRVFGDTAVAIHGLSSDDRTGLDLFAEAARALDRRDGLDAAVRRLAASAPAPLSRTVAWLAREDPLALAAPALQASPAGIVLARFERGEPHLGYIRFRAEPRGAEPRDVAATIQLCPGSCPTGSGAILVSPDDSAIASFSNSHPEYWTRDLGPQARQFVESQADGRFVEVGPPIDVLTVTKRGITWLARKPDCREKETAGD